MTSAQPALRLIARTVAAACLLFGAVAMAQTPATSSAASQPVNRLARATSPYLLQHATNPVDWHEWNAEALERARREDKPIFLSIGYAACHWCHVMAHESFENAEIAAILNRHFINIKVDREERPDLDEIYMQATMMLNQGQGGWPMSVWLTPDRKPFFAGTYFPPESKWGRPGFGELCERIGTIWTRERAALERDAERLSGMIAESLATPPTEAAEFSLDAIDRTAALLARAMDPVRGGLVSGGTNKFPPSMAMDLMLRSADRRRRATATASSASASSSAPVAASQPSSGAASQPAEVTPQRMVDLVRVTLDHMARGGIYDHLGGGICRYSTDRDWLVPHFEKMLYDQALVSRIYLDAYQFTGEPRYAEVARDIFDFVLRELTDAQGGFHSSLDADSEGREGKFYTWTLAEFTEVLGKADADLLFDYFGVSEEGNWEDPHHPGLKQNVLSLTRPLEDAARSAGLSAADFRTRVEAAKSKLLARRATRIRPGLDDKVLCEWNGLMISSLARGAAVLSEPRYEQAAARAARFLLEQQSTGDQLHRASRAGRRIDAAFLTDYAALIDGLIELYEATGEPSWLESAARLNRAAAARFADAASGAWYFTAADHEALITRSLDVRDSATPAGQSLQLMNLVRLAALLGDESLERLAERTMKHYAAAVLGQPGAGERFLAAVECGLLGPVEVVIVGAPGDATTRALLEAAHRAYLPNRVIVRVDPAAASAAPVSAALLAGKTPVGGRPAAYVCKRGVCKRPAATAEELNAALADRR